MNPKLRIHFLWALLMLTGVSCRGPQSDTVMVTEASAAAVTAPVTIYLVRHAEKDTSIPTEQDPELAPQGHERAESLRALLREVPVNALYATKYKRTQQTLKPIADERTLTLETYESNDFKSLKQRLLQKHSGQTVVIAAHSNTLLPLLEELGAKTRIQHITESTYDYIFQVVVNPDHTATIEIDRYGVAQN